MSSPTRLARPHSPNIFSPSPHPLADRRDHVNAFKGRGDVQGRPSFPLSLVTIVSHRSSRHCLCRTRTRYATPIASYQCPSRTVEKGHCSPLSPTGVGLCHPLFDLVREAFKRMPQRNARLGAASQHISTTNLVMRFSSVQSRLKVIRF